MIELTDKEYDGLIKDSQKLGALEAYGVDNWEGYSLAMESLDNEGDDNEG